MININVYSWEPLDKDYINIYISKDNKKPLHNKCYIQLWSLSYNNKDLYIFVEHCLLCYGGLYKGYNTKIRPIYFYININSINKNEVRLVDRSFIMHIQHLLLNSLIPSFHKSFIIDHLNLYLYK